MTSAGAPCFNVADSWNGPIFWDRFKETIRIEFVYDNHPKKMGSALIVHLPLIRIQLTIVHTIYHWDHYVE